MADFARNAVNPGVPAISFAANCKINTMLTDATREWTEAFNELIRNFDQAGK